MRDEISYGLLLRARLLEALAQDEEFIMQIAKATSLIKGAIEDGGKILTFGNGGSALQAAHITVELEGRFKRDRRPIPAMCLNTDIAKITALSNDFGYPLVFVRQMEAHCKKEDVVIGLTTSDATENNDHSRNILEAFRVARIKGARSIGLFSIKTSNLLQWVDAPIVVPNSSVDLIQEVHDSVIHMICDIVEEWFCAIPSVNS